MPVCNVVTATEYSTPRIKQESEFRTWTRAWRQSYTTHSGWNWRLHLKSFEYSSTSYQIPSTINISAMVSTIMWIVKRFLTDLNLHIHQHFSLMNILSLFLLNLRNCLQMSATMCSDNTTLQYSSPVTGLEWPRGFQEVKVPGFHDNGTGWW